MHQFEVALSLQRAGSSVNGGYRGETVREHNVNQSLLDAMEELGRH